MAATDEASPAKSTMPSTSPPRCRESNSGPEAIQSTAQTTPMAARPPITIRATEGPCCVR
jgi:hypothetical protein